MFNRRYCWVVVFLTFLILIDGVFVLEQGKQAIVTEFGKLRCEYKEPGLYFKVPFYQKVLKYEKRVLFFDIPAAELTLADKKRIVVNIFLRCRIVDLAAFYRTIRTTHQAKNRLSPLITGAMRNVLGTYTLSDMLSEERAKAMEDIKEKAQHITETLGIEIVEVRISKTDLPKENSHAIYRQMISSLKKEAQKWRGKGREEYLKRCAKADRDSQEILSKANLEGKKIIAQADAERLKIYNQAYGLSPQFAQWFLNLQALEQGVQNQKPVLFVPQSYLTGI